MKTRNSTKSKLLSSVIALVLCVSMLIGATFAWFTDAASTGVNKIQAGTLDVALEYSLDDGETWQNAEGRTLSWQKARGHESEPVLWEPGCSYALPQLRIVNKGTLALKYKIAINGIIGDAGLMKALEFTVSGVDNAANTDALNGFEGELAANATTQAITITGKMKTDAGNEYQGLSIDGIGITVYATQMEAEFDSFNNSYDHDADYIERHATIMGNDGKTITLEQGKTYTVGNATVEVAANGDIRYTDNSTTPQTVTIQTDGGNLTVDAPNATVNHYGESDNVVITAVAAHSYHEFGEVAVLSIAQGRVVVENGDNIGVIQVKPSDAAATNPVVIAVPENVVLDTKIERTNATTAFKLDVLNSNGTAIEEKSQEVNSAAIPPAPSRELEKVLGTGTGGIANDVKNYVAINGETYYDSLQDAVNAGGTVKLVNNVSLHETVVVDCVSKTVTIDMNGYNIAGKDVRAIQVKQGALTLDGTGTVSSTVANVGSSVIRVGDNDATSSATLSVKKGVTVSTGTAYGITAFGNKYEYVHVHGKVTSTAPENADYDGCAISTLGTDKNSYICIYDGATVSAANTNAIYMPSGTLRVKGGTVTGRTGIYVKSGSTTIEGGTITGNGPAVAYNDYGNGGISTGDALVVDSCGYPSGVPSVTVSGGTFTSTNAQAVASYNTESNALVTGFVKGGTFSRDPSDYVPFGYKAANAGNTWSVSKVNSTADEPIHITSEADWLGLASLAMSSSATTGQYYVVDKDLDFTGVTQKAGLKYFAGNIDFKGHTISGLNDRNTHRYSIYRYPSLFTIVKAGATIKNLKFELPNLGTDNTVKPIGSISGTGTVTLEKIAISGNLNMTDNNTGLLVDFIGGNSKFDGTVNLIGCTSTCNMVNSGYSSVFIGGIYNGSNKIVLNATDCVNSGKISSTGSAASMLISNPTRYKGDSLTLNIKNCRNEGQIIAAPGTNAYLVIPYRANGELNFLTEDKIKEYETSGDIVNKNGGISASLDPGKLALVDGKFDLTKAMEKVPDATRFELAFGFQGTGGLGAGGVTQYTFSFDSRGAVMNVPANRWVNASEATGELTAHNEYGTTYYTDAANHYVYNLAGYLMNNQPEVSFIAYDADGNVMLVDFYSYAN